MRLIFIFLLLTNTFIFDCYAQNGLDSSLIISAKFLKNENFIYSFKKNDDYKKESAFFIFDIIRNKFSWDNTLAPYLYPSFSWDVNDPYLVFLDDVNFFQTALKFDDRDRVIYFLKLNDFQFDSDIDIAHKLVDSLKKVNSISKSKLQYLEFKILVPIYDKHKIVSDFNIFSEMSHQLVMLDQDPNDRIFYFDWGVQKDNTLTMYVAFNDSLFH
jgi:hypothetical protein